ncbi:hypothetical protein ABB37_09107 [Leptomonas pyrrhocoris]|uniref:Uncharacterized protein n=1 Tax=Leptomonas pyrrhocoris TaxID=157538 RepID=A0A0N0DRN5_LEPPY|nr:hypothetical protein ABB37_09107 [Leptomonas pyrrhocoris]KPA74404.1 hypothetical protein ABB37_09107 [Leptomonas pyrrhocoris]|eukprot:XP_015652843.1 hypothetical protein ABB37_09107 [Leptomonas pyrrhocoris]
MWWYYNLGGNMRSGTSAASNAPSSASNRQQQRSSVLQRSPAALPCESYYDLFPEDAGPLGNVVMSCSEELQEWLLVARPVPAEEAESKGGCVKLLSLHADPTESPPEPQYFCITDPDDVVYGRAQYIPRCEKSAADRNEESMVSTRECWDTSDAGCTDASMRTSELFDVGESPPSVCLLGTSVPTEN